MTTPVIRSVIVDTGMGFCVERRMLEVKRPPFLSYLLSIETPEQVEEALAFARQFEERKDF
jgi:hypothetical protein